MDPWHGLGQALLDYLQGDVDAALVVHSDIAADEPLPAAHFFRGSSRLPELERKALELCRGRVLDIGAGAGAHSLALQQRGLEVVAIDICPAAVEVMRRRGLRQAFCADIFQLARGRRGGLVDPARLHFDTLLLMMNGIGVVGDLAGLERFARLARRLVQEGGQVLLDSVDPAKAAGAEAAGHKRRMRRGRYHGEVHFRLEYKGVMGEPFAWLFVDPLTLAERAGRHGWKCQVLGKADRGQYLARLVL